MLPDKKMLMIINPVSGKKTIPGALSPIIRTFMDGGYLVTTAVTRERGEATELTKALAGDYDLVVCAGGDGTLNETVSGLLLGDHTVPVGYLPCGSTNDFAISHGLSADLNEAAEAILSGRISHYDVGQFENRFFTYVAAFGAFSSISYSTDQNLKNMFGHAAYFMGGLMELSQVHPVEVTIQTDDRFIHDEFAFGAVCNTTSIAGALSLPEQLVDTADGKLEVLLVRMPQDLLEFDEILHGLLEQDYSSDLIELFSAKSITITTPEPTEWSLDGEASGMFTSFRISAIPDALHLVG